MNDGLPRREFVKQGLAATAFFSLSRSLLSAARPTNEKSNAPSGCNRIPGTHYQLEGRVKDYLTGVTDQWLKVAPTSNPAMLEMFRDRDRSPLREMVPWAGEFAGKYLTSAVQVWRVTGDVALKSCIQDFVTRLMALQAEDGYLGPWPRDSRLTGRAPNIGDKGGETWDAWGHYHVMMGLLLWEQDTSDFAALLCVKRIADLFCARFGATRRLVDIGSTEMNLAPIHALALLYRRTGDERYLNLALKICDEFAATDSQGKPLAGDYLNSALSGKEFYQFPKPRWESLHSILGLAELYRATGDDRYRRAFEQIWWSIVKLDRHNNGGFSSGEQAQGNPYHPGAIETCCTIAWIALSVEMLRMTENSVVADELELSTLNAVMGLHSPTGRWVTYNTPMDGVRKASAQDIVFQARAGSPELNCCSVNGARGFGMISDWAILQAGNAVVLNWYGPGTMRTRLPSGHELVLQQQTAYPQNNHVRIRLGLRKAEKFAFKLRVPYWSRSTFVRLNGEVIDGVTPGQYLTLERKWRNGDTVEVVLDFSLHFWVGERECADRVSAYRGPILLTYDRRFNDMDPDEIPTCNAAEMTARLVTSDHWIPPMVLVQVRARDGRSLNLCDFASAGVGGSPYRSWLPIAGVRATPYSRQNPLRSSRISSA